jgi:hypothetical protein
MVYLAYIRLGALGGDVGGAGVSDVLLMKRASWQAAQG